jgi:hypothetical protein
MYRFPRSKFVDTTSITRQLLHIISEFFEIIVALIKGDLEHAIHESFDAIHSLETLIRKIVKKSWKQGDMVNPGLIGMEIITKNDKRGYYDRA